MQPKLPSTYKPSYSTRFTASSLLYTAEAVVELDQLVIQHEGLSATQLMKRAGRDAFHLLLDQWPNVQNIQVFCGAGNNAGDGYILASLARQRQIDVVVRTVSSPDMLSGAAADAYQYALREGVTCQAFESNQFIDDQFTLPENTVLVDALLGTGSRFPLSDEFAVVVEAINQAADRYDWPVLALDIPTGVNANTGAVATVAIKADATLSFIGQKQGNFTGTGRVYSGQRYYSDLGVDDEWLHLVNPNTQIIQRESVQQRLPSRDLDAHKNQCGHVLIVGGDSGTGYGYGGAPIMAAQMALRAGSGLVSVATRTEFVSAALSRQPEMMVAGIENGQALLPMLARATGIVIGPGLGQSSWSEQLFYQVFEHAQALSLPLVIDADALRLMNHERLGTVLIDAATEVRPWILTPHAGEAASLLGISVEDIERDRFAAAQAIHQRYHAAVILKGAGTIVVTSTGEQWLCDHGNPGMASGGMGDVLSGLLGALLVQGMSPDDAALLGVVLHAQAADQAINDTGLRSLLATDLLPWVGKLLNQ